MGSTTSINPAADGVASVAPVGSTGPTDTTTALNAAFKDLGYVEAPGLTGSMSADFTEIKNWKGTTVKKVQTGSEVTFKVKFLQTTRATLELYTGGRFGTTDLLKVDGPVRDARAWVFDILDPTNKIMRIYCPNAEITGRDDWELSNDSTGYGVTITAYPVSGDDALQIIVPAAMSSI